MHTRTAHDIQRLQLIAGFSLPHYTYTALLQRSVPHSWLRLLASRLYDIFCPTRLSMLQIGRALAVHANVHRADYMVGYQHRDVRNMRVWPQEACQ